MNTVFEDVWLDGDDIIFEEQLNTLSDYILDNKLWDIYNCSLFSEHLKEKLPDEDNKNWCGSGGSMVAIDCEGVFYPCNRFTDFSLNLKKPRIIGNYKDGIDKNKLRPFLVLDRYTQSSEECFNCEVSSGCSWCTGFNYDNSKTGTIFERAMYICKMHKARARAVKRYWKKFKSINKI